MTQDEIIEMADKAKLGSKAHFGFVIYQTSGTKELEAFAKLVAAKERDALLLFLRNLADDHTPNDCADMIVALQSLGAIRARSISRGEA